MAMDVKRDPAILRRKKIRQILLICLGVVVVGAVSWWAYRLRPAAPSIEAKTLYIDTVKRGSMVRQVRGSGTLTPEDIRWIPATTSGRVERIVLRAGAQVKPDSVIVELSNPDLQQTVRAADLAWKSSQAQLVNQRATLRNQQLTQKSNVTDAKSQHDLAVTDFTANKTLFDQGVVGKLTLDIKQAAVDQATNRLEVATEQYQSALDNEKSQLAPLEADVNLRKADYDLKMKQMDELKVRAGMTGVLQVVPVERGQQIGGGTNVARVANPAVLKAELKISETQMKDVAYGQLAEIDTRNGIVKGRVSRIDPAAQGGTRGVDVELLGPLPAGAVPDLSVDGTIELERLENIIKVGHPTFGTEGATVSLFKLTANGEAIRVQVKFGKSSVNEIEIKEGLQPGDQVILSDMSNYDGTDRVRLI